MKNKVIMDSGRNQQEWSMAVPAFFVPTVGQILGGFSKK
jgi:hypothetical protein